MNDLILAQACADTYYASASWEHSWQAQDIHVRHRVVDGDDVIAFRGSSNAEDLLDDFRGWPKKHLLVGWCHAGFVDGMDDVLMEVSAALGGRRVYVSGHSLGGARALILGGMLVAKGIAPLGIATFGAPRPGFARLSVMLNGGGFPIRCYKNRRDPVTDVPYLGGLYTRPVEQTRLDVAPAADDGGPFADHHMPLYLEGVRRLQDAGGAR